MNFRFTSCKMMLYLKVETPYRTSNFYATKRELTRLYGRALKHYNNNKKITKSMEVCCG